MAWGEFCTGAGGRGHPMGPNCYEVGNGGMEMQKEGAKPHPNSRQGEMAQDVRMQHRHPPSSPLQWHRAGRG